MYSLNMYLFSKYLQNTSNYVDTVFQFLLEQLDTLVLPLI